jgi:hypothetical protein
VTEIEVFDKCVIQRTIHEFCAQEKTSATISKLLPKLNDRTNFKGGSTSLRNIVKELGFLWKTRNNRVVLIEKHDERCRKLNSFVLKITCKDYHHLLRKYTSGPVFFVWTVLPGGRRRNIIILLYKWLALHRPKSTATAVELVSQETAGLWSGGQSWGGDHKAENRYYLFRKHHIPTHLTIKSIPFATFISANFL